MPTLDQNRRMWETEYAWSAQGDEWSRPWGGTANVWQRVILPRIEQFLPSHALVEIAPGFGRWTQFLKDRCDRLIAIDLSSKCVEACRLRFANSQNVTVLQNDGRSIPMVDNESVDFLFTFDSLVHVDTDTLSAYLKEIARVLAPSGTAFIHHSNLGEYRTALRVASVFPARGLRLGIKLGVLPSSNWRDPGVTGRWVAAACREVGLFATQQEFVNWRNGGAYLVDCFTTIRRSSVGAKPPILNRHFMSDARKMRSTGNASSATATST